MTTARNIITLALEGMNKLSPGEAVDADLAAICLRRLNAIADDWSAGRAMMPQDVIVSGAVTGQSLTLAAGPFAAIGAGDEIISAQSDGYSMTPITMEQYNNIWDKVSAGRPTGYAHDGLSTVFLFPASNGSTIHLLVRKPFTVFADLDTNYIMPSGYQGAFAATLSVALAPSLLGGVPPALLAAERKAMYNVSNANVRPAVINSSPLRPGIGNSNGNVLQGWR